MCISYWLRNYMYVCFIFTDIMLPARTVREIHWNQCVGTWHPLFSPTLLDSFFFFCGKRNLNPTGTHRSHGTCCSQGCQMACVLWSGVDVFEKDPGHSLTPLLYRAVDSYSYMDGTGWPTSTYLQFTKEKATQKIPKVYFNVVNPTINHLPR